MAFYSGLVLAAAVGVKALLPKLSSEDKNQQTHDADNDVHPDAKPEEKQIYHGLWCCGCDATTRCAIVEKITSG